jgi:phage-related protein
VENLKIVKGSDTWTLPDNAWIKGLEADIRTKQTARSNQHGKIETGDGKVDGRVLELTIFVDEASAALYHAAVDAIKAKLYRTDQKLYVSLTNRYINLARLDKIKDEMEVGFAFRRAFITASFRCNDPFWYSTTAASQDETITTNPQSLAVINTGNVDAPAVITVTAATAVPSIKITNAADGREMTYNDTSLTGGAEVVFDSAAGTVKRDGTNTINNFGGTFLQLQPGSNTLTFEGAACELNVSYTPRWL